jgi:hypothetical protein
LKGVPSVYGVYGHGKLEYTIHVPVKVSSKEERIYGLGKSKNAQVDGHFPGGYVRVILILGAYSE